MRDESFRPLSHRNGSGRDAESSTAGRLAPSSLADRPMYWVRLKWIGYSNASMPARLKNSFLYSRVRGRGAHKDESAHLFCDGDTGRVTWDQEFKAMGVALDKPAKRPYEVKVTVLRSQPGQAEVKKIGSSLLNLASHAPLHAARAEAPEGANDGGERWRHMLQLNGGLSSYELAVSVRVQASQLKSEAEFADAGEDAPTKSNVFSWLKSSKHFLSGIAMGYNGDGGNPEGDAAKGGLQGAGDRARDDGMRADGSRRTAGGDATGTAAGKPLQGGELAGSSAGDSVVNGGKPQKGHKRQASKTLFALLTSQGSESDMGEKERDKPSTKSDERRMEEGEGPGKPPKKQWFKRLRNQGKDGTKDRNGGNGTEEDGDGPASPDGCPTDTTVKVTVSTAQQIAAKGTRKDPFETIAGSPGQLEAIELVRKFKEESAAFKRVRSLGGNWETIEIKATCVDICFAGIDQCSEGVDGHAACSLLAVAVASWVRKHRGGVPDKDGELDLIIRSGSQAWRELFESNQDLKVCFPDMHLDLDTARESFAKQSGASVRFDSSKSFVGFLPPQLESKPEWMKECAEGLLAFDDIWDEVVESFPSSLWIVAWNDHFFVVSVKSADEIYVIDTLGVRLCEGCDQAFIARFETEPAGEGGEAGLSACSKSKKFIRDVLASNLEEGAGKGASSVQGSEVAWATILRRLQVELHFIA